MVVPHPYLPVPPEPAGITLPNRVLMGSMHTGLEEPLPARPGQG